MSKVVTTTRKRPIIFSAPMVRAILEGRKTQTRRIDKRQNDGPYFGVEDGVPWFMDEAGSSHERPCPYGKLGDRLWVREMLICPEDDDVVYAADGVALDMDSIRAAQPGIKLSLKCGTVSPIHMPRWASRITLEITDVRVQRVQEISEEDSIAEGLIEWTDPPRISQKHYGLNLADVWETTARAAYQRIWNDINGTGSWERNPWVWAITFKRKFKEGERP